MRFDPKASRGVLAAESVPAEAVIVHSINLAASTPSYLQVLTPGQGVSNSSLSLSLSLCVRARASVCECLLFQERSVKVADESIDASVHRCLSTSL